MTIQLPAATIADEIFAAIRALLMPAREYFRRDSTEIAQLLDRADKLQKSDAQAAFQARSLIYMLCGDRQNSLAQIRKAHALGFDRNAYSNACAAHINLGYFSEAQEPYRIAADPQGGGFRDRSRFAINCGALSEYVRQLEIARKMQLEIDLDFAPKVERAAEILGAEGVTDAKLGAYLDVLGEIMREQRMFFVGPLPDFFVWTKDETNQFVHIAYRLPVEPRIAERLDTELVTRYLDRFGSLPDPLSITIKSGLTKDGRITERAPAASPPAR